jgi:hypothetical protein
MFGFVNVSNMSDRGIQRLGHEDDVDQPVSRYNPQNKKIAGRQFSVSDVWAAASAAQRVNGEYLKDTRLTYDEQGQLLSTKRRNRDIMVEFLHNPDRLLAEDVEAGEAARTFLAQDLTFRTLKNKTGDFDQSMAQVLAVQDHFDTVKNRLEFAVVACLPQSHQRAVRRLAEQDRMATTVPEAVGEIGTKVRLTAEVVSSTYSQNFGVFWIKAITSDNRAVFFAYKNSLAPASTHQITGSVKRFDNGQTQLNRVKIG